MKTQELILRAMAKRLTWWQAAEIIGISDRSMRRWKQRYQKHGYDGLFDRRRGKPSPKRVPLVLAERVLELYQEKYRDFNVRHFHEKRRDWKKPPKTPSAEGEGRDRVGLHLGETGTARGGAGEEGTQAGRASEAASAAAPTGDAVALGRQRASLVSGQPLV